MVDKNCPGEMLEDCVSVVSNEELFGSLGKKPGRELIEDELRQELLREGYRGVELTSYLEEGADAGYRQVLEEYDYMQRVGKKLFKFSHKGLEGGAITKILKDYIQEELAEHVRECEGCRKSYESLIDRRAKSEMRKEGLENPDKSLYFSFKLIVDRKLLGVYE